MIYTQNSYIFSDESKLGIFKLDKSSLKLERIWAKIATFVVTQLKTFPDKPHMILINTIKDYSSKTRSFILNLETKNHREIKLTIPRNYKTLSEFRIIEKLPKHFVISKLKDNKFKTVTEYRTVSELIKNRLTLIGMEICPKSRFIASCLVIWKKGFGAFIIYEIRNDSKINRRCTIRIGYEGASLYYFNKFSWSSYKGNLIHLNGVSLQDDSRIVSIVLDGETVKVLVTQIFQAEAGKCYIFQNFGSFFYGITDIGKFLMIKPV